MPAPFRPIEEEAAERLPVEAVLLLDTEGGVEVEGQLEEGAERPEDGEEGEARADRAEAEGPRDPARTGLDDAEATRGQERERDHDLHPAVDEAEAVSVARVGDRLRHLVPADVEGTGPLPRGGTASIAWRRFRGARGGTRRPAARGEGEGTARGGRA